MFPGKLREAKRAIVAEGWPTLLAAMADGQINTPRRIAAFLTTLVDESWCEYSVLQGGSNIPTPYLRPTDGYRVGFTGRGYIQITGEVNYRSASEDLGVDLVDRPELAQSLEWSAKIAVWYWTKERPKCNAYADLLQMGKINAAIGYPFADGKEDLRRCASFAAALEYLTGAVPAGITCTR